MKAVNEIPQLSRFEYDILTSSTSGGGRGRFSAASRVSSSSLNLSSYNLRPRSRASNSSVVESLVKSQDVSKLKSISNRNKTKIGMLRQAQDTQEETTPKKGRRKSVRARSVVRAEYSADED